jgi:hypothetical protein
MNIGSPTHSGGERINLLPAIERGAAGARLYYEKDGHCTAAGHAVIADELFHYLMDRGLVP